MKINSLCNFQGDSYHFTEEIFLCRTHKLFTSLFTISSKLNKIKFQNLIYFFSHLNLSPKSTISNTIYKKKKREREAKTREIETKQNGFFKLSCLREIEKNKSRISSKSVWFIMKKERREMVLEIIRLYYPQHITQSLIEISNHEN